MDYSAKKCNKEQQNSEMNGVELFFMCKENQ